MCHHNHSDAEIRPPLFPVLLPLAVICAAALIAGQVYGAEDLYKYDVEGVQAIGWSDADVAASWDDSVGIWSFAPGSPMEKVEGLGKSAVQRILAAPHPGGPWAVVQTGSHDVTTATGHLFVSDPKIIKFFDANSPSKIIVAELKTPSVQECLGFTKEGNQFFYATAEEHFDLGSIDPHTGKVTGITRLDAPDIFDGAAWGMLKVTTDGKSYVLCMGDEMVAKDLRGKELWRIISGKGDNIYQYPPQPAIADGICVYSSASNKIYVIDIAKGKQFAEFDDIRQWTDILAVSQDATRMIVGTNNGYEIRAAADPNGKGVQLPIPTLKQNGYVQTGFIFSFNGMEVMQVPGFKFVKSDPKARTATMARASSVCNVWDTETGKLLRSIDLKIPEAAASASRPQSAPTTQP